MVFERLATSSPHVDAHTERVGTQTTPSRSSVGRAHADGDRASAIGSGGPRATVYGGGAFDAAKDAIRAQGGDEGVKQFEDGLKTFKKVAIWGAVGLVGAQALAYGVHLALQYAVSEAAVKNGIAAGLKKVGPLPVKIVSTPQGAGPSPVGGFGGAAAA